MDSYSFESDRSLMKRLNKDQLDAFDLLYEKYSRNLYSFCRSLLKTHEDAEGVVEEVFLRVWKKRSELLEQKSFKIFLFQLAYTVFIDHFSERSEDPEYEQFVILQAQRHYLDLDKKVEKDQVKKKVKKPVDELSENWM